MSERTLVLIKPDGVARGLVGEVLGRIERKGFTIVAMELRTLTVEVAEASLSTCSRAAARVSRDPSRS